jgi:hypothetical protein
LPFSIVLLTERTEKLWIREDNAIEAEKERWGGSRAV